MDAPCNDSIGSLALSLVDRTLELSSEHPVIMGIVNVGNDSVADSSSLPTLREQLPFALAQVADGAQIIDIGVQSGRTDTPIISAKNELQALLPLVTELASRGVIVSVDTWRAEVADGVVRAGAHLINDVSGLADPELADVAAQSGAALVVMHTRAAPKQRHFPVYEDVVADVHGFLEQRIELAESHGVRREQILIDPGPDFAKTPEQSIRVLRELENLRTLRRPVLLAVSRKYFVGMLTGREPENRLAGTLAAVAYGLDRGASVLRVHDVAAVSEFLAVRTALRGSGMPEFRGLAEDERLKWIAPKLSPSLQRSDVAAAGDEPLPPATAN